MLPSLACRSTSTRGEVEITPTLVRTGCSSGALTARARTSVIRRSGALVVVMMSSESKMGSLDALVAQQIAGRAAERDARPVSRT